MERQPWKTRLAQGLSALLILGYLAVGLILTLKIKTESLKVVTSWFDPLFFVYNLLLLLLAVLIVPIITVIYVYTMKGEKERRLRSQLTIEEWDRESPYITSVVQRQFSLLNYLGSMVTLMLVITLGAAMLLLTKPQTQPGLTDGIAFLDMGANFILLGPYIQTYKSNPEYFSFHLLASLTAFQFGFLGAYVYFISDLTRSYFIVDLTPNTFVDSTVRIITASLLSLVLSFALPTLFTDPKKFLAFLPVVSFFIGFFPSRGLAFLESIVSTLFQRLAKQEYAATPLSMLPGMSYSHEARLVREGHDNLENLSHANALELAIRTGFRYRQLLRWIDQAKLCLHLREDYTRVQHYTGITGASELVMYVTRLQRGEHSRQPLAAVGADGEANRLREKLQIISTLLQAEASAELAEGEKCRGEPVRALS